MDNRTIRTAIMKRLPEVYFVHAPIRRNNKVYVRMLANIKGKLYKFLGDMPDTALCSHRELLGTLISETYDEIKAIKSGQKDPEILPEEKDYTPLGEEEKRILGIQTVEDAMMDNPLSFIETANIPDLPISTNDDETSTKE